MADYALVVTRTTSLEECEKLARVAQTAGLSLFLIDTRAAGISKVPLNTRGEGVIKQFKVNFLNVKAPAEGLIGKENEGASALFFSFNIERVLIAAGVHLPVLSGGGVIMLETEEYLDTLRLASIRLSNTL